MNRRVQKTVNQLVDLEDCIQYLRVRLAQSGGPDAEIIKKNKLLAQVQLLKKMEDLCCKQKKAGCGDLTNSYKKLQHQERKIK